MSLSDLILLLDRLLELLDQLEAVGLLLLEEFYLVLEILNKDLIFLDRSLLLDVLLSQVLQLLCVFLIITLHTTQHLNLCLQRFQIELEALLLKCHGGGIAVLLLDGTLQINLLILKLLDKLFVLLDLV